MKYSLIDIGSNTVRLVIYDTENNNKEILNKAEFLGLISYVNDGKINEDGEKRLVETLNAMKKIAENSGSDKMYAFATASLRDIKDKDSLIEKLFMKTGITVDIISGTEEAMYDYTAISNAYKVNVGAAFDLGGGSCQLMYFENGVLPECKSMPIGALRLYNEYVAKTLPDGEEYGNIKDAVIRQISDFAILKNHGNIPVFAMGGAACTVSMIHQRLSGEVKTEFSVDELRKMTELGEDTISKLVPKRLTTIVPALIVMITICEYISVDKIIVTDVGVRDGVLAARI